MAVDNNLKIGIGIVISGILVYLGCKLFLYKNTATNIKIKVSTLFIFHSLSAI